MKKILNRFGFTLIELLVVISIIAILASLAVPAVMSALTKGQMMQTLSNGRQLHIASQTMALDGTTTGDTNLAWPGDYSTPSWGTWAGNLVPGYMSTNDFAKMISAPGVIVSADGLNPAAPTRSAIKIYQVKETSDGNTIFLSTANYTYGQELSADDIPYGNKGFIVVRKGGDGTVLLPRQATNTNIVGVEVDEVTGNPSSGGGGS